jgi:bifunctional non-homologous end joining protein LigD
VSVPIAWEELSDKLPSDHFTVANVPARLQHLRQNPWEKYSTSARRVTADMKARLKAGL